MKIFIAASGIYLQLLAQCSDLIRECDFQRMERVADNTHQSPPRPRRSRKLGPGFLDRARAVGSDEQDHRLLRQ